MAAAGRRRETPAVRVDLVANLTASSVTPARLERVRRRLGEHHEVRLGLTSGRGHATELAAAALARGTDCVAVLGGDGTLNEVVGALAGTACPVAALPGGSTSVFARTLGFPRSPESAAEEVARAITAGSTERIGIGEANGRPFVCHTGIGWDAALVAEVERRHALKRHATTAVYLAAGLRTFVGGYDRRRPQFRIDCDGPDAARGEDSVFALVLNSDPYTFVGPRPFVVAPAADLHHPFTVLTFRDLPTPAFLVLVVRSLLGGGLSAGGPLGVHRGVRSLVARRLVTMPYQVDGDHLGEADELRVEHRPAALDVVVPRSRPVRSGQGPDGPSPGRS